MEASGCCMLPVLYVSQGEQLVLRIVTYFDCSLATQNRYMLAVLSS